MCKSLKNSKFWVIFFGALLLVAFSFGLRSIKVQAASAVLPFDVYYAKSDGSWGHEVFRIPVTPNESSDEYTTIEFAHEGIYTDAGENFFFPNGASYDKWTYDLAALEYPSDAVPSFIQGYDPSFVRPVDDDNGNMIYHVIFFDQYEAPARDISFTLYYPEPSTLDMLSTTLTFPEGTLLLFGTDGIYNELGDCLLSYAACNSYYSGAGLSSVSSIVPPTGTLPFEMSVGLWMDSQVYSVYSYSGDVEDSQGRLSFSVTYPNVDGKMVTVIVKADKDQVLTFDVDGIYYTDRDEPLFVFDQACNSYFEGTLGDHQLMQIPTGSLPHERETNDSFPKELTFYNFSLDVDTPVLIYNSYNDVITFESVHDHAQYRVIITYDDESQVVRRLPKGVYKFSAYDYVDYPGEVSISVQAYVTYDRYIARSDESNGILWTAAPPTIDDFYIDGHVLNYSFSGKKVVGELFQSGLAIISDISPGTYQYKISNIEGLVGFQLVANNKYGTVKSDSLDFYIGFANDDMGAFYAVGVILDDIIDMLDSVKIMGISLWMFLCTSFVITLVIPLICLIVLPSRGMRTIGGNRDSKSSVEPEVQVSSRPVPPVRGSVLQQQGERWRK